MIHEKGFFSSNPLTSSDNEVGVIREDVIELRRASLLGFAFNKLGNHMTLKVRVTISIYLFLLSFL